MEFLTMILLLKNKKRKCWKSRRLQLYSRPIQEHHFQKWTVRCFQVIKRVPIIQWIARTSLLTTSWMSSVSKWRCRVWSNQRSLRIMASPRRFQNSFITKWILMLQRWPHNVIVFSDKIKCVVHNLGDSCQKIHKILLQRLEKMANRSASMFSLENIGGVWTLTHKCSLCTAVWWWPTVCTYQESTPYTKEKLNLTWCFLSGSNVLRRTTIMEPKSKPNLIFGSAW